MDHNQRSRLSGAFSNVYKAIDLSTGEKVAGECNNLGVKYFSSK